MPLLRARIKDLLINERESTFLTVAADASSTSITVEDNNQISQNDILMIGQLGTESAEMVKVNASVSYGTALTVAANPTTYSGGTIFAHPAGLPVYRLDYDQVEFSYSTTLTGAKSILSTVTINPGDLYTRYDDTTNTTGFGFFRFKNSISGAFSSYSDGVSYGGYNPLSLHKLRERVRRYLQDDKGADGSPNSFFDDFEIDDAINDAQWELAQQFRIPVLWKVASFSTVANQREYGSNYLPSDFWFLYDCTVRTQPQQVKDEKFYNLVNWNSNTTASQSTNVYVRNRTLVFWPTHSGSAQTTTLSSGITATSTTIPVASTSGFAPKGRVLIGTEVIEYDSTDATNFYLHSTEQRGMEGTTAASAISAATVTNRDIIVFYFARPATLTNETDTTVFDDADLVAIQAAYNLAFNRFSGDKEIIDRFEKKRDKKITLFKDAFGDQYADNFTRVKRKFETIVDRGIWPQVLNPQNLTQQNP